MAAELIFNLLVGLGLLFLLFEALALPQTDNPSDVLGAGGYPLILCVLGLVVLAVITVRVIREKKSIKIPLFDLRSLDGRAVALNVALLFVYIMAMEVIGFILSTLLYLAAAGWLIGYRKPLRLAIYAAILTAAFTAVFGMLFYVPLPRGVGQLRELSYLIY
ncbi:MAG: tripartite tricarboxylate transporter TctB family protein [Rhodospirillales bacterium]|jgi:hypothetical protein|nr:tripartite tricarboxylate transporter TctB family protein [Rhodospirillales bacterium]